MPVEWEQAAWTAAGALAAGLAAYLAVAWVASPAVVRAVRARNPRNQTLVNAVRVYARAVGVAAATVAVLVVAGYGYVLSESAIVIAAATLAIGVAGQDVFENVVSGVFLVADENFNVGDWVAWGDDRSGTVEVVGFRTTRVRTVENEVVTVPNAELATRAVTNPYARGRYRVAVTVDVAHDADLDAASEAAVAATSGVEGVVESPPPEVVLSFGDGTVRVETRAWLRVREAGHADVVRARSRLTRAVRDALADAGVEASPAPTRELSGRVVVDSTEG